MTLHLETDEGVAIITLDRPETLNAFDDELGKALLDALQEASGTPSAAGASPVPAGTDAKGAPFR